jgi:hypothetical protein
VSARGFEKSLQNRDLSRASVASAGDKGRTRSHAGGTERIDQLSLPYTKGDLTGLAESFLRDFPVGEFPYLMEHVRQHVTDRPQGKATTSSGST